MFRRLLLALVLVLALVPRAVMAQTAPTASVSTVDEAFLGDQIPFQINLSNAGDAAPPDLASILERDWVVQYNGEQRSSSSNMTVIINGRVQQQSSSSSMSFVYALTPRRAGTLTIPAIEVQAKGKVLRTEPVTIKVSEPAAAQGLGSVLDVSRAYVGQPVKLTLSWILASTAEDPLFNLNLPEEAFDVLPLPPAGGSAAGAQPQLADVEFVKHAGAERARARGTLTQASIDGEVRTRFTIEFMLIPRRAGRMESGAARVDFRAVVGQKERTVFDAPWERRTITQRRFAQAPAKTLEVLDLPAAGRPADFSGLVGQYELDAECQPRQASVGDPLNLTLVLRSKFPLVDPPTIDLTQQRGSSESLAENFRVPRDPVLPQVAETAAIYAAQIRPKSARITEVPPVELSYFDPAEQAYRVAKSNRIPLKVSAAAVVGLGALEGLGDSEDAADAGGDFAGDRPAAAAALPETINGFFPPLSAASAEPASVPDVDARHMPAVLVGTIALPTGLWLAGAVLAARRRLADRDAAAWRRRGATRRAARSLRRASPENPAAISSALRAFIADWFDLPPEAVTTGEAAEAVRAADPVLASRVRSILDACDQRLFGPEKLPAWSADRITETSNIIREIARSSPRGAKPFAADAASAIGPVRAQGGDA
jgi:hypothetical protein